jgi:hypothetical protein
MQMLLAFLTSSRAQSDLVFLVGIEMCVKSNRLFSRHILTCKILSSTDSDIIIIISLITYSFLTLGAIFRSLELYTICRY